MADKDNKPTMTIEEMERKIASAASVVKLICGVGNNAAWLVVLEAYGHAKQHPRFNQSAKGGKRYGWYFRRVMKLYHDLLYRSSADTVAEYDEVFSTKGHQKKVLREIAEVREETQRMIDNDND